MSDTAYRAGVEREAHPRPGTVHQSRGLDGPAATLLEMQRTVGNQAVAQLLGGRAVGRQAGGAEAKGGIRPGREHIAQALAQAGAAVEQGQQGNGRGLEEHAKLALEHARAGEIAKASAALARAGKNLQDAIDHASSGRLHVATATKAAQEAVNDLRAEASG
jgi:hypothetical protein